jgi:glycosyltransferase involved in cell wall biosynthesis
MTLPLISVVLPVRYVHEAWLRKSIESVLQQDYPNKELIVVNDDATQDIDPLIREYGIHKYIKNDRNRKLPYSLNRGFEKAEGVFHTWTSADNYMLPGMLSRLYREFLGNPSIDIAVGRYLLIDDAGNVIGERVKSLDDFLRKAGADPLNPTIPRRYCYYGTIGAAFLYRAGVWTRNGGYDEKIHGAEDYKFWIVASRCAHIVLLSNREAPLYAYRLHGESMSTTVRNCFTHLRLNVLLGELRYSWNDRYLWINIARIIMVILYGRGHDAVKSLFSRK